MCIKVQQKGEFVVATFTDKRLDAALATEFEGKMKGLIDAGHQRIILDLSNADFIDSSGLGAVVASFNLLGAGAKGELILCGAKGAVASLFKLTRMDKIFAIYPNIEKALRAECVN